MARLIGEYAVSYCPPAGRGSRGSLRAFADGSCVFTSDEARVSLRAEDIGQRPGFAGRLMLSDGSYLLFGSKRGAKRFLAEVRPGDG